MKTRTITFVVGAALLLALTGVGGALAATKTYTFSGTSNLECPDFSCPDFLVTVSSVEITGGSWTKTANSETSSHKKAGTVTDCVYPDLGTVSVGFTDAGIIDANDKAKVTILSSSTKNIGGTVRTCTQTKVVNITGTDAAAVVVNFDIKSAVPSGGPAVWAGIAALLALVGGVVVLRRGPRLA